MKARMYDPTVGRFYSADPQVSGTDALSLNPYIYTGNNPINRIDPDGKGWRDALNNAWNWTKDHKAVIAGVAAGFVVGALLPVALPTLAAAAIIGAVVGATTYTVANWGHVKAWGIVKAAAIGAITAVAITWAVGIAAGAIASRFISSTVTADASSASAGVLDQSGNLVSKVGNPADDWTSPENFLNHYSVKGKGMTPEEYNAGAVDTIQTGRQTIELKEGSYRFLFQNGKNFTATNLEGKIITNFNAKSLVQANGYFERNSQIYLNDLVK